MGVLLPGVSCFIHFLRIELEEVGDAIGVGAGRRKAVCLVNERVEFFVREEQVRRHRIGHVKYAKRTFGVGVHETLANVQYLFRSGGDLLAHIVALRPREVVVHNVL